MKYLVRTKETEIYDYKYLIEANNENEAQQLLTDNDWEYIDPVWNNYSDTVSREILEIIPYNEN